MSGIIVPTVKLLIQYEPSVTSFPIAEKKNPAPFLGLFVPLCFTSFAT